MGLFLFDIEEHQEASLQYAADHTNSHRLACCCDGLVTASRFL